MKMKFPFAPWSLSILLGIALATAQAQSGSDTAEGPGARQAVQAPSSAASTGKNTRHAKDAPHARQQAKKASRAASNPGTSGGAGNKSGSSRRDGADFDAPRPGAATSAPTGTGWDGYDAR